MHAFIIAAAVLVFVEDAKKHAEEQDLENGIRSFLGGLATIPRPAFTLPMENEEKVLYDAALSLYLAQDTSAYQEIIQRYESLLATRPNFHHLRFLVAAAYANTGNFPLFFEHFALAFQNDPDHYLAHKTQSVLMIRLWERIGVGPERNELQEKIVFHLLKAQEKEPADQAIYKMVFRFVPPEKKGEFADMMVKKLLDASIMVPRGDVSFYVNMLLQTGNRSLAQIFLEQAKLWYPSSRTISSLEQMVN